MLFSKIQSLYYRRKAISPVIATILLIALTVSTTAIVYFLVVPLFTKTKLIADIYRVKDTNKDSKYDQITLQVANSGTIELEISEVIVWTSPEGLVGNDEYWKQHKNWTFQKTSDSIVNPSELKRITLSGQDQISLSIIEETYYRLEIRYSGQRQPYYSDWELLNDQVDFGDLIDEFESFNLQAWGFEGTIDVPGWPSNNYKTSGGEYVLQEKMINYLEVLNESELIPFYISGKIVVFHSTNGNLTNQPTVQSINLASNPLKAGKLFVLGLAGSWGDELTGPWALTLNVTYTDNTNQTWELGPEYIDDWWLNSNDGDVCTSEPYDKITLIDLGTQVDYPNQPIHTHTTRFFLDYYKYIKAITFIDPGNDESGPHLISLTLG
ncbi:MAG: hypothetical protein GF308_01140 [Candidatus Heimdallarchaeota archaeon]|nr:hypothetical protein [Candidatus Heimdallarchaeota archaeon]